MRTLLEKSFLAGIGLLSMTHEKAQKMTFLLTHSRLILVALFISACITYLWYAYAEYHWLFHKPRRDR